MIYGKWIILSLSFLVSTTLLAQIGDLKSYWKAVDQSDTILMIMDHRSCVNGRQPEKNTHYYNAMYIGDEERILYLDLRFGIPKGLEIYEMDGEPYKDPDIVHSGNEETMDLGPYGRFTKIKRREYNKLLKENFEKNNSRT